MIPNAPRTLVAGVHDGALRLRLSAPPVDGAANDALVKWLADQLGVPRSRIELVRGATARRKGLRLAVDEATLRAWVERLAPLLAVD